ncbi:MAG: M28 family metallopeptidase [Clostridia bacterium]|nr:M28 family metallopeptidase [Clostridia bacterium]
MNDYPFSEKSLLEGVEKMNSFGSRPTGSKAHNDFIGYIKDEISAMGIAPQSDIKYFDRWQAKSSSIVIHTAEGDMPVHVSSPFPYSGETDAAGITAEAVRVHGKHINYLQARDKIAVIKVHDFKSIYSGIAFNQKAAMPKDLKLSKYYKGPVASAFVKFPFLQVAHEMGVKAAICIWEDMSSEMVEGQYLNFILDYQGIPALWVNEADGKKIIEACERKDKITLTLLAEKETSAVGETVYAAIEGKNKNEAVIINTHTDGVNCVEENGAVSLLAMMKYFTEHKPERTLIFAFVCGHFRLPKFKAPNAISDQSTSLWLYNHKDLWDGKDGHIKAVAGLTVEHLGCTEWKDYYGEYKCTNPVDIEVVYTGNKEMDKIYFRSLEGRSKVRTVTLRGHNFLHFGEGQSLFNVGIPEIALVTAPDYLCVESENHEMDKFDPELMYEQTVSFVKMAEMLGTYDASKLGKADTYTFGIGKL